MSIIDGELVRFGFHHLRKSKKFWAAIALSSLPLLAGIIMLIADINNVNYEWYSFDPFFTEWVGYFAMSGLIPLLALILAGGLLADESQDRTLTYLLLRPIPRSTLYVSKFIPVATFMAILASLQVLTFGLMRLLALSVAAPGTRLAIADSTATVSASALIWGMIPVCMIAAALVGVAYCAIFAFVSLIVQRFHFMVNLLFFLVWEVPWSSLGAGAGYLTVLFYGHSFISKADPTIDGFLSSSVAVWVAVPACIGAIVFWVWMGALRIRKQDFHITSAAT